MKLTVELWDKQRFILLILKHPTGIFYTNQVGGVGIYHPEIEGFAVPVSLDWSLFEDLLNDAWRGTISDAQYKEMEEHLLDYADDLKLIRNREEDAEAWVHVKVVDSPTKRPELRMFGGFEGVLTWTNSD